MVLKHTWGCTKSSLEGFRGLLGTDVRNSGVFRRFVVGALFGGFLDEIRVYLTQ